MTNEQLISEIAKQLRFTPTDDQRRAMDCFAQFVLDMRGDAMMLLTGSAGTGKTSVAAAIVKTLRRLGQRTILLCPTGRACKVLATNCGQTAHTIHRKIYRQKTFRGLDTPFQLSPNKHQNTMFIVDEASMINHEMGSASKLFGTTNNNNSLFGTGDLLDDLIHYVYSGKNCRLLLIGDRAQLPPVGMVEAPALLPDVLRSYDIPIIATHMDQVLRQAQESGVLYNATRIRHADNPKALIRFTGFNDLHIVPGSELIERLCSSYNKVGLDETMVVVRSNKLAARYNNGIRNMILGREEELSSGDRLMIVKNNYFYTLNDDDDEPHARHSRRDSGTFIANGDTAVVRRVRRIEAIYGFRFADVTLQFPDYNDSEIDAKIILDSLTSLSPALTYEQQQQLMSAIMADYADLPPRKQLKAVREDKYYNALQVKYAYAVTCHKAQGGQWSHVYVDQGFTADDAFNDDYRKWLYTAFTRTTDQLYLVNWKADQTEELSNSSLGVESGGATASSAEGAQHR